MQRAANATFQYGVVDCCLFAAAVAREITGRDYADRFTYNDEATAYAYIDEAGGLSALISECLDLAPVPPEQLELGDPVLVDLPVVGHALGVYAGVGAICKTECGAIKVRAERMLEGWPLCRLL